MIRDCKENNFRVPAWRETDNIVTVSFKGITHNKKEDTVISSILVGITKNIITKNEGVNEGVKDRLMIICAVLYKNSGLRTVDIEKQTNIPIKSVERYIKYVVKISLYYLVSLPSWDESIHRN